MPIVLSHRGNLVGASRATENSVSTMRAALWSGWSLETDIRRSGDGRFYVAHDPQLSADDRSAELCCALFRAHPEATVALNVKERGNEAALVRFLEAQGIIDQSFLFDMELVEPRAGGMARRFRDLHPTLRLAARVSDWNEPVARALGIEVASIIWLDEFDGPWATESDIRRLKDAGRTVHAVSPDLHGASFEVTRARWLDFIRWGVDGICTDYAAALDNYTKLVQREAAA